MTVIQLLGVIAALFVPNVAFLSLLYTMVKEQKTLTKDQHDKTVSIEAQVKNTHSINLRDDMDDKHSELLIKIGEINHRVANIEEYNAERKHIAANEHKRLWNKIHHIERNQR